MALRLDHSSSSEKGCSDSAFMSATRRRGPTAKMLDSRKSALCNSMRQQDMLSVRLPGIGQSWEQKGRGWKTSHPSLAVVKRHSAPWGRADLAESFTFESEARYLSDPFTAHNALRVCTVYQGREQRDKRPTADVINVLIGCPAISDGYQAQAVLL